MKKLLKKPLKPTVEEERRLGRYFYLPDWQFGSLIENRCTLVSSRIISWDKNEPQYAGIYGLNATKKDSGKNCFANFFLFYHYQVYQFGSIEDAVLMIDLLKKEFAYEDYQDKLWKKRQQAKQKRKKERSLVKKSQGKVVRVA